MREILDEHGLLGVMLEVASLLDDDRHDACRRTLAVRCVRDGSG